MTQDQEMVFNGINGATGEYGLAPRSIHELVEHIDELHEYEKQNKRRQEEKRAELERMLERENSEKIVRIVRLLAESNAQDTPRDAGWHENWVERLAEEVAELLPGDEYLEPDKRGDLEEKLAKDTVDKTVEMVRILANTSRWTKSRAEELETLLLRDPHAVPDHPGLGKQIDREFRRIVEDTRAFIEEARQDSALTADVTAREAWLAELFRQMHTIPVDAYNAKENNKVRAARLLVAVLEGPASTDLLPGRQLDELDQKMDALPAASWRRLLDALHHQLQPWLATGDGPASWDPWLSILDKWLEKVFRSTGITVRGVIEGVDRTKVEEAGWGIIFPWEPPQSPAKLSVAEIKEALRPLLELRESQAGEYFKVYEGGDGYRPDEAAQEFLTRHGATVYNPADPEKVPYYLLIVGSPEQIPFHFQYQLDVQYAVGRLDFDRVEDYANYARSVVAAETLQLAPTATFFGPSNPDDRATELSTDHLVRPLGEHVKAKYGSEWQIETLLKDQAPKSQLQRLMGGDQTPALLFAACHGVEFPKDDPKDRQVRHQGALLCQDWGGPLAERGEIPTDYYLSGEDLGDDVNLLGLIGFFFACYSAGTPVFDEYYKRQFRERGKTIADQPFTAALPKAMLSRPRGGALAVVGHVERAWGTSYLGPRQLDQIAHFESAVKHLLNGHPIGSAMEYFDGRYAALSTELIHALEPGWRQQRPSDYELAELWTANNDARGYVVIGDPAVRLPVAQEGEAPTGRPTLGE